MGLNLTLTRTNIVLVINPKMGMHKQGHLCVPNAGGKASSKGTSVYVYAHPQG